MSDGEEVLLDAIKKSLRSMKLAAAKQKNGSIDIEKGMMSIETL